MWRPFKFFSHETLKGSVLDSLEISAICSGRNNIAAGDPGGYVRVFDKGCKATLQEFSAYSGPVTHIRLLRGRNVVLTIGDDDTANVGILRVWDLDRPNTTTKKPLMKEHRLFTAKFPPPPPNEQITLRTNYNDEIIARMRFAGNSKDKAEGPQGIAVSALPARDLKTCIASFDFTEDLQHVAIGLTNGEIVFLRGDLERERSVKIKRVKGALARDALTFVGIPRSRAHQDPTAARPGATNAQAAATTSNFATVVYVVYKDAVTVWRVTAKGDYFEHALNTPGGAKGSDYECSCINEGDLVVAFNDGASVATYGGNTFLAEQSHQWDPASFQPPIQVIEGDKCRIGCHRGYLMTLSRPQPDTQPSKFVLQMLDTANRIRALNNQQSNHFNVAWILTGATEVLVICQDAKTQEAVVQKVMKLSEVDMQAKLEQLFSKHMYNEANEMVRRSEKQSIQAQMDIERKYGDHLYGKGKFDEAIERYINAIGYIEPSYVIRLFLDTQRIHNLTRYLEELHTEKHRIANKNHTTLLLNCYTKQKDEAKLQKFITRKDIVFDALNAIKVCREAGYYDAATYLARTHDQPGEYVMIEMEHRHNHHEALQFVRTCSVDAAEKIMLDHGKELLASVPAEATEVMIQLCTEWKGPPRKTEVLTQEGRSRTTAISASDVLKKHPHRASPEQYIPIFVDTPLCLMHFLEAVIKTSIGASGSDAERLIFNTLLELYLTKDLRRTIRVPKGSATSGTTVVTDSSSPGARKWQTAAVAATAAAQSAVMNAPPYDVRLDRAMQILEEHEGRYDKYHALVLVQQHEFERGIVFMLQSLKLHKEIFAFFAKQFESKDLPKRVRDAAKIKLIQTCENRRTSSPEDEREMWISLLTLLMRSVDDVSEDITRVLNRIERDELLPPIAVIDILSSNPKLQLKTVRDYILRMLRRDYDEIERYQTETKQLGERVKKNKDDVRELQTCAVVFQSNKCAQCNSQLDNPAVHFLCRHSYHERCLNEPNQCNLCSAEHTKMLELNAEYTRNADNHNQFFVDLRASPDGFAVVADYFGRLIFSNPKLRKDGEEADDDNDGFTAFDEENNAEAELEMW